MGRAEGEFRLATIGQPIAAQCAHGRTFGRSDHPEAKKPQTATQTPAARRGKR